MSFSKSLSMLDVSLYLILDPTLCGGLSGMLRVAEAAISGGVTMVQLRAPECHKRTFLEAARALLPLCRIHRVPLIINDHVDVALAANADGVHVGQRDLPVDEVRRLVGGDKIVGISVSNVQEWQSVDAGIVDYLGLGPVWATATKPDAAPALGLEGLRTLLRDGSGTILPTVAIGGIDASRVQTVMAAGVDGVAVVSAICASATPEAVARELRELVRQSKRGRGSERRSDHDSGENNGCV